ncbi:ankyrin repeat domain-containing protein 1-like isoform X1 [Halichondria panicea]|uniref:ankyrin repeat domain-containing protein 1-like isoform X1 n=1 Tax=Halichondria panicea TaxID=6063 RepID=UPI00312B3C7F
MAASHDLGQQLYKASRDGRVDEVERLLARGAPINWRDSGGRTALHWACINNHPDVVKILTQQDGIDVNAQDTYKNTPLHKACYCGHLKCVQLLMATGQCDLGAVNYDGLTPLGGAVRVGKLDTIKYLITECNVNINGTIGFMAPEAVSCHDVTSVELIF